MDSDTPSTTSAAAPALVPDPATVTSAPAKPKDPRAPHLAAWFDAVTDAQKKSAVAAFPQLKTIFSEAQNY